jgi:predicted nucleotidyltransferase
MNSPGIATPIADPLRSVALLTLDIENEEKRADVRDLAYPVLARSLRIRTDNIETTIASFESDASPGLKAA